MSECSSYREMRRVIDTLEGLCKDIKAIGAEIRALRCSTDKFAASVPPEGRERLRLNQRCDLLDPIRQIYRVPHDVTAIYDAGVQIEMIADWDTPLEMIQQDLPGGYCSVCRKSGLMRLGAMPTGTVTCDGSNMTRSQEAIAEVHAVVATLLAKMGETYEIKGQMLGDRSIFEPIIPGDFVRVGEVYVHEAERFEAIERHDYDRPMIYDNDTPIARPRCLMPDATPGSTFCYYGRWFMVTEIKDDLVFFEPVEPAPIEDDPEG